LRALVVSNLVTIHQKTGLGRLSAFCGVVSAGCGAGAGIAWLHGGRYEELAHTMVNALAIVSGMVCDGAKPSCAAKIASSVDAGLLGFEMYRRGKQFYSGEGLVSQGVEPTIVNVGRLGCVGMSSTDKEIIRMMLGEEKNRPRGPEAVSENQRPSSGDRIRGPSLRLGPHRVHGRHCPSCPGPGRTP